MTTDCRAVKLEAELGPDMARALLKRKPCACDGCAKDREYEAAERAAIVDESRGLLR